MSVSHNQTVASTAVIIYSFDYIYTSLYISAMKLAARDLFTALSHDTRLRCVALLARHGELCVCELTHALGAAQPHVSHHLAQLRESGLIVDRRQGLWVHYRINPELPGWAGAVLGETLHGIQDESPFADDDAALADMPNRPGAPLCA